MVLDYFGVGQHGGWSRLEGLDVFRLVDLDLQFRSGFFAAPLGCRHQRSFQSFRGATEPGAALGCSSAGSYGSVGVS